MIDKQGFRLGVGILMLNDDNQVFLAKRIGQDAWQLPQGGLLDNEAPDDAVYRELNEEVGLEASHVECVASTPHWLSYRLPKYVLNRSKKGNNCIGQKQKWFLLRFQGSEQDIALDKFHSPEFDDWRWVSYWYPLHATIHFKRNMYRRLLNHFTSELF